MSIVIRELIENVYSLPSGEASENTIKYLFTYFNVNNVLRRGLLDLTESTRQKEVYNKIIDVLDTEVYEFQSDVLIRIEEYGNITSTDVSSIDDMKVMHFLAQSLTSRCLNIIPTENLKAITRISYNYMKKQVFYVAPDGFTCIMVDKLDHMYDNENISIREIWDLFGRFGIYSILKLLYLLNTQQSTEDEMEKPNESF